MRKLLLSAAALLAAGCGAQQSAQREAAPVAPRPIVEPARTVAVQVTVVDGDTNRRVSGARVRVGGRSARSDRHGVARVPLMHRGPLDTSAAKPGYGAPLVSHAPEVDDQDLPPDVPVDDVRGRADT